jgi:hypothetical protein
MQIYMCPSCRNSLVGRSRFLGKDWYLPDEQELICEVCNQTVAKYVAEIRTGWRIPFGQVARALRKEVRE